MKAEQAIQNKKRLIRIILILIAVILLLCAGIHIHTVSGRKNRAAQAVTQVVTDLQNDRTADAEKILGRKASGKLAVESMSADTYMKTIVSSLGYTSGNPDTDAGASYTGLLKAGGADDTVMKNMKKLHQTLKDNGIVSYHVGRKKASGNTVTVSVDVNGIILLPKVSFAQDARKANQQLADYVNKHMDDLIRSYNGTDDNEDADAVMNASLKKQELSKLVPAMIRRVKKTKKTEETWTFTVDVSSDQAKIQDVSVSTH